MLGYNNFRWKGDKLMLGARNTGAKIIPDAKWPGMFRVEYPPGVISDLANLTRIRDAAVHLVAHHLNSSMENATLGRATDVFPAMGAHTLPERQQTTLTTPSSLAA
jgi:hypothetical protein